MKFKTTQKEIKNNYGVIIMVGYCGAQHLLNFKNPIAYTAGKYGWNADVYEINHNVAIVTGYRPFGNTGVDYETLHYFEKCAESVHYDNEISWNDKPEIINRLLNDFVNKCLEV